MPDTPLTPPPLAVLFEDYHLIAVNKPAPLLTQAPPAVPSLEARVKAYIKAKHAKPAGVCLHKIGGKARRRCMQGAGRLQRQALGKQIYPAPQVVLQEGDLGCHAYLQVLARACFQGVGLLEGQGVHKLQFNGDMIRPLPPPAARPLSSV